MTVAGEQLEPRIQAIGQEIFAGVGGRRRFDPLMKFVMRDEGIKSQLFRFVDCLPVLRGSSDVTRHLREYLDPVAPNLARLLPSDGSASGLLAAAANFAARGMARTFIAATDVDQAVRAIQRLRRQRLAFTLDLLGESVVSEREAEQYQSQYLSLIQMLPSRLAKLPEDRLLDRDSLGPIPRLNLSLKLSSLYSQFDPIDPMGSTGAVLNRLRPILRAARNAGAFVNLDMENHALKDLTIRIFQTVLMEEEFRDWTNVGIAIQAYLRGTLDDLHNLADWAKSRGAPVWIRLVKGAYWDIERVIADQNGWPIPVFTEKSESDANFEDCAEFLIANHALLHPALATHNIRSIAASLAMAEHLKIPPEAVEFQMLYGMADPIKAALVKMGRRVRVYTPFGRLLPGMAYLVRRLLENSSNESFLRAGFIEHVPVEKLLMNPRNIQHRRPAAPPIVPFTNEPPGDFSLQVVRDAMKSALENFEKQSDTEYPLIIGGKSVRTEQWIQSVNPSHTNRNVGRCGSATVDNANAAVAAAKNAFFEWRDTPANARADLLDRVANYLSAHRWHLSAVEVCECGKPWREADADVAEAIDFCRYYAWQMRLLAAPNGQNVPGELNRWTYESRGVAVVIAPWNFPLAILCGMTAAAIVAGNPVVMKPAEQSSVIAAYLAKAFSECGAPAGVVNYLPGIGEEIGPVLVNHPDVAMIAFTGSRAVGLSINEQASKTIPQQDHVKRIITEMGGKNAIILDDDADLDDAVAGITASAFGYAGQKCSACSRVIAVGEVHHALLERLIESARSLKIAPAEDPACKVGPVIDAEAKSRIESAIESAKKTARLAYAGEIGPLATEGYYIAPHIFADVDPKSALAQEEIFGPVLAVIRARNFEEALEIANGTRYALTGGIYSRSPAHIEQSKREFRVGNLYINRKTTGAIVGRQPFGGFKLSGAGTQAGGPDYLRHFLLPRCITENT
ncbi:MAG: L-glutamate gamma-semialdehyde dehydrogenase, partial [Tepidisphaeraceae bacterium]